LSLLEVKDLSFKYALSNKKSLCDINLKVEQGDFLCLFGPSGSGKTTLLRHLKRELMPEGERSGRILFQGKDITEPESCHNACDIGYVMQNPDSQIVTDVVWHELAFGLENLKTDTPTIRRRVAEMASFFGIGSWFHKKTSELSGGQKQLLNLASIIIMQPKLLLLDEPTSQLDPVAARDFIGMISRLNRELGITIIITEHRLEDVLPLANRAVMMDCGRIKYEAEPRVLAKTLLDSDDSYAAESLPAAARIFGRHSFDCGCPLTVKEGRQCLFSIQDSINSQIHFEDIHKSDCKGDTPAVQCRNLYFRYQKDSPDIFKSLSFEADYGEFICLMGENGSGKSTLLNLIAGLFTPQHGKILIGGRDIKKYPAKELYYNNIAMLPQNPKSIFLHDTLREELSDLSLAEKLGLTPLLDRHPYDLSGGEQQRAAFARVLEQSPRILLLDEPTKGLDAQAKRGLAGIIADLCKNGTCVIASTHDIEFAAEYAHRCLLLFDGIIASEGSTHEFFSGNSFYTTAANRIARDICPDAITCEDVIKLCGF